MGLQPPPKHCRLFELSMGVALCRKPPPNSLPTPHQVLGTLGLCFTSTKSLSFSGSDLPESTAGPLPTFSTSVKTPQGLSYRSCKLPVGQGHQPHFADGKLRFGEVKRPV